MQRGIRLTDIWSSNHTSCEPRRKLIKLINRFAGDNRSRIRFIKPTGGIIVLILHWCIYYKTLTKQPARNLIFNHLLIDRTYFYLFASIIAIPNIAAHCH